MEVRCVVAALAMWLAATCAVADGNGAGAGDAEQAQATQAQAARATQAQATQAQATQANAPHSRQKRIVWITNDGRLALPPGTSLVISPSLSMPFIRYPPPGFFSNLTMSLPFTIDFDKLGLTDNENPYGDLSPLFSRELGRAAGGVLANFIGQYLDRRRGKRSAPDQQQVPPHVEREVFDALHGGERALLYGVVEDMLTSFGLEGKPCLLRAICEIHAHPMTNFGLLGEMAKLFFTASRSPFNEFLDEYVRAERAGSGESDGPGECWPYYKECPKSIFMPRGNKYSRNAENEHMMEREQEEDEVEGRSSSSARKRGMKPMKPKKAKFNDDGMTFTLFMKKKKVDVDYQHM